MTYSNTNDYDDQDRQQTGRRNEVNRPKTHSRRATVSARRGVGPTAYTGIHRRRKKRIMW